MRTYCLVYLLVFVVIGLVTFADGAEEVRPLPTGRRVSSLPVIFTFKAAKLCPS